MSFKKILIFTLFYSIVGSVFSQIDSTRVLKFASEFFNQSLTKKGLDDLFIYKSIYYKEYQIQPALHIVKFKSKKGFVGIFSNSTKNTVVFFSFDNDYNDSTNSEYLKKLTCNFVNYCKTDTYNLHNFRNRVRGEEIQPLIKTTWAQGTYYNQFCPADPKGPDGHALVGCVAVSIAQILKYYNYPAKGKDSINYFHKQYGNLSVNFKKEPDYKWDKMPEKLTTYNNEVARLLYHCGLSVAMYYGPDGSVGAYPELAFSKYFSFSPTLFPVNQTDVGDSVFASIILSELQEARPVYISAYDNSKNLGHAFIIDGYQNGYFHVNWGWNGNNNGYFQLSFLSAGNYDFSYLQSIVAGIRPANQIPENQLNIIDDIDIKQDTVYIPSPLEVSIKIKNISNKNFKGYVKVIALNIENDDNQFEKTLNFGSEPDSIKTLDFKFDLNKNTTVQGNYKFQYYSSKTQYGPFELIPSGISEKNVNITYAYKTIYLQGYTVIPDSVRRGQPCTIIAQLHNTSKYDITSEVFVSANKNIIETQPTKFYINGYETVALRIPCVFKRHGNTELLFYINNRKLSIAENTEPLIVTIMPYNNVYLGEHLKTLPQKPFTGEAFKLNCKIKNDSTDNFRANIGLFLFDEIEDSINGKIVTNRIITDTLQIINNESISKKTDKNFEFLLNGLSEKFNFKNAGIFVKKDRNYEYLDQFIYQNKYYISLKQYPDLYEPNNSEDQSYIIPVYLKVDTFSFSLENLSIDRDDEDDYFRILLDSSYYYNIDIQLNNRYNNFVNYPHNWLLMRSWAYIDDILYHKLSDSLISIKGLKLEGILMRINGESGKYSLNISGKISKFSDINENTQNLLIYPNPASKYLIISTLQTSNISKISIYDILGKPQNVNYFVSQNRHTLNTGFLKDGIYFIEIEFNNHQKIFKKIIIKM